MPAIATLGWAVVTCGEEQHVLPQDDIVWHTLHPECSCRPAEGDEIDTWVHQAVDGRTRHELGAALH